MVSRRDLLARAGRLALLAVSGGGPPLLSGCTTSPGLPATADPELASLVDAVIGVDMHSHAGGVHLRSTPSVNLAERLRLGRMTAACLCHTGDGPVIRRNADQHVITARNPGPGELWRHTQSRLDFFDGMIRAQGLRRALKAGDLEAAHRERAPAIVQSIESSQFVDGRVERVAEVYRRGVRQLQLVHFFRSELGDNQTESPDQGGLTALGRQIIAECNRLGIVVDTAHGTMQLVEQAAAVCRTPLLLSHTAVTRRPAPSSRLVSREHAMVIAPTSACSTPPSERPRRRAGRDSPRCPAPTSKSDPDPRGRYPASSGRASPSSRRAPRPRSARGRA